MRADGSELPPDRLCPACKRKERERQDIERYKQDLEDAKELQLEKWFDECGVPGIFIEKSFADFESELQPKAFDAVKGWMDTSLVLLSPGVYGVGKTHLVCALAEHLLRTKDKAVFRPTSYSIQRLQCPVTFTTESKLLARIRNTFNRGDDYEAETEAEVYKSLAKFPLLIIDDVGKVRPRDYSFLQGVYFNIIDDRYVNEQYIILTTNLDYTEIEEHIGGASADRLREMCGKNGFIKMTGKSYRRRSKQ